MSLVLIEKTGPVTKVTLNLPDRRNPISDNEVIDALLDAVHAADSDQSVRAIILTGAGTAFSSGGDLSKMEAGVGLRGAHPIETDRNYRAGIQRLPLAFQSLEVPVIAAACRLFGKESGKDVLIGGYDNKVSTNPWRDFDQTAPCITVDKKNTEVGRKLIKLLDQRINNELANEPVKIPVEGDLIVM